MTTAIQLATELTKLYQSLTWNENSITNIKFKLATYLQLLFSEICEIPAAF